MEYIERAGKLEGCIFCDLPALGDDKKALILARGELAFVVLNKFPYNSGHVMVAPYRHTADYEDVTLEEHTEIAALTQAAMRALAQAYQPQGYNIGVNQGRAAGAGIVDHVHVHVVPRWDGDTNYMTTVGGTKVLPETLEQTYAKLRPLL